MNRYRRYIATIVLFSFISFSGLFADSGNDIINDISVVIEKINNPKDARECIALSTGVVKYMLQLNGTVNVNKVIAQDKKEFYRKVSVIAVTFLPDDRAIVAVNIKNMSKEDNAMLAESSGVHSLVYENGRWLNEGYEVGFTWERFASICEYYSK